MDRFDTTIREWEEQIKKAEIKLANSQMCFNMYGDEDSAKWIVEDTANLEELKAKFDTVKARIAIIRLKKA